MILSFPDYLTSVKHVQYSLYNAMERNVINNAEGGIQLVYLNPFIWFIRIDKIECDENLKDELSQ